MPGIEHIPTLSRDRSPTVALIVGFLFGAIGLGIYFRSFLDFVVSLAVCVLAASQIGASGLLVSGLIIGVWGYLRAHNSNGRRRAAAEAATVRL
jgi:hypothetical protein